MYTPLRQLADALFRLAFTVAAPAHGINQATYSTLVGSFFNRNAVMVSALRRTTPTPCKRTVSDTISSPSRATFQLSITVLVHYRSGGVFSLATSSWLLPTGFLEPRRTLDQRHMSKENISSTGLSPSLAELSSSFDYISLVHAYFMGNTRLSPQHLFLRQPTLITDIRGQTCVQLGSSVSKKGLDWSGFARRY